MCLSPCFSRRLFKSDYSIYRRSSLILFVFTGLLRFTYYPIHWSLSQSWILYLHLSAPFLPLFFQKSEHQYVRTFMLSPKFPFLLMLFLVFFLFPKRAIFMLTCSLWAVSMPSWNPTQQTGLLQMTNSANVKLLLLDSVSAAFSFPSWLWP